jgi:ABC-2 type transport system permease protein
MFERLRQMLIKEFIQVFRDPRMKGMIFGMPLIQLLIMGYAVNMDVKHIATAVYDLDQSVTSRELVARFANSGYFKIKRYLTRDAEARELMDHGEVQVILHLNPGFERDLLAGKTVPLQVILDGTDSNTAAVVLSYSLKITVQFSQDLLTRRLMRMGALAKTPGRVQVETRAWFNENLESRNFFVPGVIALLISLVTLMLTSMAIVREKELGTMEQIIVTPIRPHEFILGKTVPFALIGYVDVVLVIVVGVWWFEVPLRGNLGLLFGATTLYLLTTLGVGLLISTVSQTQQQAMMTTFFFFQPAMLLSGFVFPIANMPRVVQWITFLNPLRYFLVIIRGIFLKGVGAEILWPQMLALAVLGSLIMALATRRFRKTLA